MKKKKKENTEEQKQLLAQDLIPLQSIQGSFMRRKDGVSLLAVYVEGVNDSLYTEEQRLEESAANARSLMAINHPFTIIKIPRAIDSHAQLVHLDNEIAHLQQEIRAGGREMHDNHPAVIRMTLLEQKMRPIAEHDALMGDRIEHPTYFVFEFKNVSDDIAMRDTNIFVEHVSGATRQAHICSFDEVLELLQLYFTPKHINLNNIYGNTPVMTNKGR